MPENLMRSESARWNRTLNGTETFADNFAAVDDGNKRVGVVLMQEVAQHGRLVAGQHCHQHGCVRMGVGAAGLLLGG